MMPDGWDKKCPWSSVESSRNQGPANRPFDETLEPLPDGRLKGDRGGRSQRITTAMVAPRARRSGGSRGAIGASGRIRARRRSNGEALRYRRLNHEEQVKQRNRDSGWTTIMQSDRQPTGFATRTGCSSQQALAWEWIPDYRIFGEPRGSGAPIRRYAIMDSHSRT